MSGFTEVEVVVIDILAIVLLWIMVGVDATGFPFILMAENVPSSNVSAVPPQLALVPPIKLFKICVLFPLVLLSRLMPIIRLLFEENVRLAV